MSKKTTYTQCRLRRGESWQVSWVPSNMAIPGKYLKLKNSETGEWVDGWRVEAAFAVTTSFAANERSQDYKHQRNASDI